MDKNGDSVVYFYTQFKIGLYGIWGYCYSNISMQYIIRWKKGDVIYMMWYDLSS